MKIKEYLKNTLFILMASLIIIVIVALVTKFPTHQAHNTIKEYLKIIITWPGVILILSLIILYIIRFKFYHETKIEFIEIGKPEVTSFITIIGKTKDGNIIIKNNKKDRITDGNAVVNKAFILKFFESLKEIKSLKAELKKYQAKLLEKQK